MAHEQYKALGSSLKLLMEGFCEVERSIYATPKEKEIIKAGIDAIIVLENYICRIENLPFERTSFSEGVASFREISESWKAFETACVTYKKIRQRHPSF